MRRILDDTAKLIEEMQVTPDEFWKAVDYLNRLGSRQEAGLLAAGLGLEHYLDLLLDAQDAEAGLTGGTPRTIEGPLYVAGAPLSDGEARMDDGRDPGTVMFLQGRVSVRRPAAGRSHRRRLARQYPRHLFLLRQQSVRIQPAPAHPHRRRRPLPCAQHRALRLRLPERRPDPGTARPPRPPRPAAAHIHFFVSAPGHRHLTTQINLAGDRYLWDDFAYATRDGLIGDLRFNDDPAAARDRGVEGGRFAELDFDFQLQASPAPAAERRSQRPRALQE